MPVAMPDPPRRPNGWRGIMDRVFDRSVVWEVTAFLLIVSVILVIGSAVWVAASKRQTLLPRGHYSAKSVS